MTDPNELREIERERLRTLVPGDTAGAREVHADDFRLINPAGEALSREEHFDLIASGQFRYDVSTPPTQLWGLPAVPVRVLPAGRALVGAFSTCAGLWIRSPVNVRLSDADQDDFIRNRVTALAELRAGLMVSQPSAFVTVAFSAAGPTSDPEPTAAAQPASPPRSRPARR
jgi:hypothetical protein